MNAPFDDMQKTTKDGMDAVMRSTSAMTRGVQTAAAEAADYAKRSFEHSSQTVEQLMAARTLDRAAAIQSDYAKAAYEGFVAYATKLGQIYTDLAKEAVKPVEGAFAKANSNVQAAATNLAA